MIRKLWPQSKQVAKDSGDDGRRVILRGRQLLIYLPEAQQPRVWCLPLKLKQPIEFTLRPLESLGQVGWCLLYLNPLEPQHGFELARFTEEATGRAVLAELAETLWKAPDLQRFIKAMPATKMNLPSVIRPYQSFTVPKWVKILLFILVFYIIGTAILGAAGRIVTGMIVQEAMQKGGYTTSSTLSEQPSTPSGVPVDANDFLSASPK